MQKYLKLFDKNRANRALNIYKEGGVKYVIKYNNCYYSKVIGNYDIEINYYD